MLEFLKRNPLAAAALPTVLMGGLTFACIGTCVGVPCIPTGVQNGLWLDQCPATDLRLHAEFSAGNLARGQWGNASVRTLALWMDSLDWDAQLSQAGFNGGVSVQLALLDESGAVVPGVETREETWGYDTLSFEVKLPEVPDGDYRLRATVDAGFELLEVDADVSLYAPALVHVMSDRPLYKPGQDVLLRAAVLERGDSTPLEQRPGKWKVVSPSGVEMLLEKQPTDDWGLSSTSFPLAAQAEEGTWQAHFITGGVSDTVRFDVKPFKLPRFEVTLDPAQTYFRIGDSLEVKGTARYSSGAPVANARVRVSKSVSGRWPMPLDWETDNRLLTDSEGKFELDLGEVPVDLMEATSLNLAATVVDENGESIVGRSTLPLSVDDLKIESVTELKDGLVENFNNRAYVRVTRPDGAPLRNADITLTNTFQPDRPAQQARTDVDGVASIQLDPGAPVTITVPAPPVRIRPLTPDPVRLSSAGVTSERGRALNLAERRAADRVAPEIAKCGVYGAGNVEVGVLVDGSGAVRSSVSSDSARARCVEGAARRLRMPSTGKARTYSVTWAVPDTLQPSVDPSVTWAAGGRDLDRALNESADEARKCLPRGKGVDGAVLAVAHVSIAAGQRVPRILWESQSGTGLAPGELACVRRAVEATRFDEPVEDAGMGFASFRLDVPKPPGTYNPGPSTRMGFAFDVVAELDGEPVGSTTAEFAVGSIPSARLRPTPALAKPGETVEFEILRGPNFRGELPEELVLMNGTREVQTVKLAEGERTATFTLPENVDGYVHVDWMGARGVVFVQPAEPLQLALSTDQDVYQPGESATLTVTTTAGESPTAAAVSLVGVDKSLGQLASLTGPDDWGRVTVRATGRDAFGQFGPRALQLGQIRGENASLAAVLLVQNLPMDSTEDVRVGASGSRSPDEVGVLTLNFYRGLEDLVKRVRAWEDTADDGTILKPDVLAGLWNDVLSEASEPIVDAYGRPLSLRTLPPDLLAQTDPRQLVADSRHLPEDVVNWTAWVEENVR